MPACDPVEYIEQQVLSFSSSSPQGHIATVVFEWGRILVNPLVNVILGLRGTGAAATFV